MSQSDRELSKSGKSTLKEGDGSDLSLSGSQVSLVSRPRSVVGKASFRALSVSGPRVRRPMSAVPTMSFPETTCDKRRPYSADSQLLLSSYHQKRNKLSACFSLSADPMGLAQDIDTDGDIEFSSSTLVSSQLSDQLGGAWMELEMRGLYMGHSSTALQSSSTDNGSDMLCYSDVSEDHTRSEKSLGERIQAMARDHIHPGRTKCAHSTPLPDKIEEMPNNKSPKGINNHDPKQMSTKELHLRMVESGLMPYPMHQGEHEHGASHSYDLKMNSEMKTSLQERSFIQAGSSHEFSAGDRTPKSTSVPSDYWNQNRSIIQTVNQSGCDIEEISFPKEHDVDSLGGDSSSSLNGLESQRRGKSCSTSLPIHSRQEDRSPFSWTKSDFGPVRFHQWVTDSSKATELSPSEGKTPSEFYREVCLSHTQNTMGILDHDCTVEEVLTDSEYLKLYSPSSDPKVEKGPSQSIKSFENLKSGKESECLMNSSSEKISDSDPGSSLKEDEVTFDSQVKNRSDSPFIQNTPTPEKCLMEERQNLSPLNLESSTSSKDIEPENVKQPLKNSCKITESKENENGVKGGNISKQTPSSGKRMNRESSSKKAHNQYLQTAPKKKSDIKVKSSQNQNGSNRRLGKNSGSTSSRSFTQTKEESLPGESQPELISWMAMCSEKLGDKNAMDGIQALEDTKEKSEQPHASDPSVNDDSPYHEIMTILRVLEDKEDESSLLRILNRRSEPRISQENPVHNVDCAGSSKVPCSEGGQLKSEVQQPPPGTSPNMEDSSIHTYPESKSVEMPDQSSVTSTSGINIPNTPVQGELRDLLTFLDAVDQSCSSVLRPRSPPIANASTRQQTVKGDPHNLEGLLLMGRTDLAQEIVSLRLALEDKDATINLLRAALREQKDSQTRQNAAHSKEIENRVRQVKTECEAAIKRHQKFIDQLIADKADLGQKCESLVQEVKENEEKHMKALASAEERHKVEMQRVKDITAATEKLKRERWVENKTQKIKELTVRGLEPELSRLTTQHEQEMSALRTLHAQELEQMEVRAARRASQQMETLREQLVQEKEDALAKERDMLRQRMEKQQLLFEEEGAEQRRRLVAEVRREQDRLATLEARLQAQFEERKRALEREAEQERERLRRDYADKVNELHRKQQIEILQCREALKAEKESWIESYQQQQKQSLIQTTNEIRDQLKRERDREIEVVIERLENEATISREEREKLAENRLKRVREQLTSELRDVESALNSLKEKHADLRSQLQEKEDKLVSYEALNRSLHTQVAETRRISDQLSAERADLKQALQAELSCEMESLRKQLAEQHVRHQQQLQILSEQGERERQTHQQELQQVFDRVKLAIAKKEEVVKVAKAKQKAAEEQTAHLQALLEHRRKESFLS